MIKRKILSKEKPKARSFPKLLVHKTDGSIVLAKNDYEGIMLTESKLTEIGDTIVISANWYAEFEDQLVLTNL